MLVTLNVQNFAIIDNIQIDFKPGLSVLTGETGAGKSLIIDAIGLLFGKRASSDMIRYQESKATIEGVFSNYSKSVSLKLDALGIEHQEDDMFIIKREIHTTGKNICRVNNQPITLTQLVDICEDIGDIHSQLDTIGLINPKNYLAFLITPTLSQEIQTYELLLKEYRKNNKEYEEMLSKSKESKEKEDFLRFQLKEFEQANLKIGEEEELKSELQYWSNHSMITESLVEIENLIVEKETLDNLYRSVATLQKLEKVDSRYSELKSLIEEHYYSLDELFASPLLKNAMVDFDEQRLDELNLRLAVYSNLKRKYKLETKELVEMVEKIKNELNYIDNYDFYLQEIATKKEKSFIKALEVAKNMRKHRQDVSKNLVEAMKHHLNDLQLKNSIFEIAFNELPDVIVLKSDGIDEVDFLVSFNKGEPARPLSKVASGGELSRFMLALKTVLGDQLPLQTKIFDEIDQGVSGNVAYSIAQKIKQLSVKSQVLCITHLPQVASICDHHYKISKASTNQRTYTVIEELSYDQRVEEIAAMISKGKPSIASIALAKELLNTSTNF